MRQIDSGALVGLNRIFGLAGGGSQTTDLDDGLVNQTFDVTSAVRRARALGNAGLFFGVHQNNHAAANNQESEVDPYALGAAITAGPATSDIPATIPQGLDLWMISVTGRATANFTSGALFIESDNSVGYYVNELGANPGGTVLVRDNIVRWDANDAVGGFYAFQRESGDLWLPVGRRILRGETVHFATTSGGAGVMYANVLYGIFPEALGQDGTT